MNNCESRDLAKLFLSNSLPWSCYLIEGAFLNHSLLGMGERLLKKARLKFSPQNYQPKEWTRATRRSGFQLRQELKWSRTRQAAWPNNNWCFALTSKIRWFSKNKWMWISLMLKCDDIERWFTSYKKGWEPFQKHLSIPKWRVGRFSYLANLIRRHKKAWFPAV